MDDRLKTLDKVHRQLVIDALDRNGWNTAAAAKEIGICRTTLWAWRKRLKIERQPESSRSEIQ